MSDSIALSVDGQAVSVPIGATVLEAARATGADVPTICYHEHCTPNGLCRMCVVEIEGSRTLVASCVTQAAEGMRVQTRTERVERSRRTILEMLSSAVDLSHAPEIQTMARDYAADPARFPDAERREHAVLDDNPMYIRDYSKCVLCWRCVQVCAEDAQYTFALSFGGRGFHTVIATAGDKPMPETTCVFCGQCAAVCPTNAIQPKREWLLENGASPDDVIEIARPNRRRRRE